MAKRGTRLSRRRMIQAGLAGGTLAVLGAMAGRPIKAAPSLVPTPTQSTGPFYPVSLPIEHDNDLVRVADGADAAGRIVHVLGTVRSTDGAAVAGARVEIWQCDANGHYHHPRDRGTPDPAFQGYGTTLTDADGAYRFRTIRPVPYTGRTPHIHAKVLRDGREALTTQLYRAGFPQNPSDFLYRRLSPSERERVSMTLKPRASTSRPAFETSVRIVLSG